MTTSKLNHAFCVHCGAENVLLPLGAGDELRACTGCGKRIYDVVTLLAALMVTGDTMRMCPRPDCRRPNRFQPHCFFCGHRFDGDGQ